MTRGSTRIPSRKQIATHGLLFLVAAAAAFSVTIYIRRPSNRDATPAVALPAPATPRNLTPAKARTSPPTRLFGQQAARPPIEVPPVLSAFQEASLDQPGRAGRLQSNLILSLREPYRAALRCRSGPDQSVLKYQFRTRSDGPTAEVLGARFVEIKRGAPLDPQTIECITRALNQRFTLSTSPEDPFLEDMELEVPMDIAIGRGPSTAQ